MKNENISIKKYILKYGLFLAMSIIIYSLVKYVSGNYTHTNLFHYLYLFFVTLLNIIAGLVIFKRNNDHCISLKEALKIGTGIVVFGGILITIFEIVLIHIIDTNIIDQINEDTYKKIAERSGDFSKENIDRKRNIVEKHTSPSIKFLRALTEDLIVGFLFSLITGLIIRKKRDPFK